MLEKPYENHQPEKDMKRTLTIEESLYQDLLHNLHRQNTSEAKLLEKALKNSEEKPSEEPEKPVYKKGEVGYLLEYLKTHEPTLNGVSEEALKAMKGFRENFVMRNPAK